jgi:hypothetical protein
MASLELDNMEYASDYLAQLAYITNSSTGTQEIPTNPGFETWSGGDNVAPDGWSLNLGSISKESTVKLFGNYSAKMYGSASFEFYQNIESVRGINYWKGKTITVGVWIWSATSGNYYSYVTDGVNASISSAHPGDSQWHFITVTHIVYSNATVIRPEVVCGATSSTVYADNIILVEGAYINSLQSYSSSSIKTQGSYSLKGYAAATDSLNKTLTKTFTSNSDLSGVKNLKLDIYSSRTGSNIKIGIHDTGGTTTEITPNILTANTWQRINWDLSNVSDANKDNIDSIIITIINADAVNTFYIDYMEIAQAIDIFGIIT